MKKNFEGKTLKNASKTITLLVALVILVVGLIVAYACSNQKVMAGAALVCTECGTGSMSITQKSEGTHTYTCSSCKATLSEDHTYSNGTCTICKYSHSAHTGGTGEQGHLNGGKCTVCGKQYVSHVIEDKGVQANESYHYRSGYCSACDKVYNQLEEAHTFSNGTCSVCGYTCTNHKWSTGKCSICGIEHTNHTGGTHPNGTCSVCGKKYQFHNVVTKYIEGEATYHIKCDDYCLVCGPLSSSGLKENHEGGTHENDGVCTKCGVKYQDHTLTTELFDYNESSHELVTKCTVSGCSYSKRLGVTTHIASSSIEDVRGIGPISDEGHIFTFKCVDCPAVVEGEKVYDHNYKNGVCTDCGYNHKNHTYENGKCTVCGLAQTSGGGSGSGNTGGGTGSGTGTGEGTGTGTDVVDKCSHTYETKSDEKYHWEECSKCKNVKEDSKEEHKGGTHEDGKCSVCEYVYQKHGKSTEIKEYKNTETGHIAIYKCTETSCTETYEEKEEAHKIEKWTDNNNGVHIGTCSVCKAEILEEHTYKDGKCTKCNSEEKKEDENCTHTYEVKNNNSQHWEECSKCGKIKAGSLVGHIYNTYTDNLDGTHTTYCTVCKYKLTEEHKYENGKCTKCNTVKTCEHDYKTKNDKEYHWEECAKCGDIKEKSKEEHKFEDYEDNGDGTHGSTCAICEYKLNEKHVYKDGVCTNCGAKQGSEEDGNGNNKDNNSDNNNNSNDDKNEDNGNSGNKDDNSKKDDTLTDQKIPFTGLKNTVVVILFVLSAGIVVTVFRMKKYKNI